MSSFQLQNSEVLARLKPFGISFEKSLSDLIKGIRAHSKESSESLANFLDIAIQECKSELTTTDLETKAMAVLKLAYLEMYGFDMSWANFQILEVMSSNKFQQKRIGYLAAIQSFKNEQDLLILATNQFKKDLNSSNFVEIGLALSGIATIVTPNLSKDINDDVLMKLNHSKPYIRKKAILAMYKIFLQYPESLRLNFNRVIEKLDDPDVSVISATVNVICEISKKNPKIFVNYLPKFFQILEDTKNNWLIIRILKLFQSLSKVEPRMKKKILPTIIDLMLKTQASSLIYECISCIVNGQMLSPESYKDQETAKLCINQLMNFFKTKDSNLKFVGLIALINIVKLFPVFIHQVDGVSNVIMDCLNDNDVIIKSKALEISNYLVNEDNIVEVVKVMLLQLIPDDAQNDTLRLEITVKIIQIASKDNYENIPNFRWYVAVLKDVINLTLLPSETVTFSISSSIANEIAARIGEEFKNLATKVPSIRPTLMKVIKDLVMNVTIVERCPMILKDLYWIMGEYIDELTQDEEDEEDINHSNEKIKIFNTLVNYNIDKELKSTNELFFPISHKLLQLRHPDIQAVLIQALVKLYNGIVTDCISVFGQEMPGSKFNELSYHLYRLIQYLSNWENHSNYEVQERALSWLEFLKLSLEAMTDNSMDEILKLEMSDLDFYKALRKEEIVEDDSSDESSDDSSDDSSEEDEQEEQITKQIQEQIQEEVHNEFENISPEENTSKKLPLLLTHILPSFFKSYSLNPVAKNAQRNIPIPDDLDLDTEIGSPKFNLTNDEDGIESDSYDLFLSETEPEPLIQLDSDINKEEKKRERIERLKDDPYYIESKSKTKTKKKPKSIIDLVETSSTSENRSETSINLDKKKKKPKLKKEKVLILGEETVLGDNNEIEDIPSQPKSMPKKNTFKIDSSNLDNFELDVEESQPQSTNEYEVDLNALREKLTQSSIKDKPKKKKKTSEESKPKKKTKKKAIILE